LAGVPPRVGGNRAMAVWGRSARVPWSSLWSWGRWPPGWSWSPGWWPWWLQGHRGRQDGPGRRAGGRGGCRVTVVARMDLVAGLAGDQDQGEGPVTGQPPTGLGR
jgi:hypothetical protein